MGITEDILNGTYQTKKKKKTISEQIIDRTYQTIDFEKERQAIKDKYAEIAPVKTTVKQEEKSWLQKILQKPTAFNDGYQFGDITKTVGGTVADIGLGAVKGVAQTGEGIGKLAAGGVAQVADWIGQDEYANKVRNKLATKEGPVSSLLTKGQDKIDSYSVIGDTGDKVSEAIGYIGSIWAGGAGAKALSGALGAGAKTAGTIGNATQTATMFSSSSGNALAEAYEKEGVTDGQAWAKAIGTGAVETVTERLFGIFGTSGLDKGIANAVSSKITSGAGKILARSGIAATGEAFEEFLSYSGSQGLDLAIDTVSNGKGAEFKENWNWEEVGEQMAIAFLASGALGAGANVSSVMDNKTDSNTWGEAINETGRKQDIEGQTENLNNELDKLEKKLRKETDPTKKQAIQEEIKWKEKQLFALYDSDVAPVTPTDIQPQEETVDDINAQQITEQTEQLNTEVNSTEQEAKTETVQNETEQKTEARQEAEIQEIAPSIEQDAPMQATQDIKTKQLEIIQKNNPMTDDYHTGIRSVEDIKTFDETINDEESFVWGDFSQEDAKKALEKGTVIIYSSKPIEQGVFVSTSQNQARDYAGNGEIYSQEVNLNDVAWINGDEGQYAKVQEVESNTKQDTQAEQEGTETTIDEDILPETQEERKIGKEWTNKVKEQDEVNRPLAIEQSKSTGNNTMVGYSPILSNNKLYHKGTLSWVTPKGKLDSKVIDESEIDNFLSKNKIDRLNNGISPFDSGLSEVIAPLQEAIENLTEQVKTMQENIAPIMEVDNNDRISETQTSTDENQEARREHQETDEIKQYKQEVEKHIKSSIEENFGFKKKDVNDIYNKIANKENPTIDDVYNAFEGHREIKVAPDESYIQEIKEIKNAIKNTRLQISDEVRQIPDWNDFRKSNFATLKLANDGIAVDSFYQELANMYPDQFDSSITNQADQVLALSEFMRSNTNTILNAPEIYNLTDSDLSEVANYIYDGLQSVKSFENNIQNINSVTQEEQLAPVAETTNPFALTDEQNARIQELRDDTAKWKQVYNERYDDKKFAQKRIKGVAMQNAAEIRNVTQGDWLIPIEGGLTENELGKLTDKLRKNYIGKQVSVNGQEGTVVGNAYGKIGVEFADGTKQYVDKNSITPLEDIDSIIQEQKEMYDQYMNQNIAPEAQETTTEPQILQVDESIVPTENIAQNGNTELSDTSKETQEQEKIAEILPERPTAENKEQRLWAKARAAIFDKGTVFEDLSIKNKNRELMSKWDYMLTSEARAQSVMINGTRQFDSTEKEITNVTKGLHDIQAEVGDNVQEFSEYLYHKHNISRMSLETNAQARMEELKNTALAEYDGEAIEKLSRKRITEKTDEDTATLIETAKEYVRLSEVKNKPVFGDSVTAEVSQEKVNEYEMSNPEFMDWAKDVYDYNKANLNQLVENGVISQETADQFAEIYPNYVPISRANVNGNAINVPLDTNRTGVNAPIARATGGNQDILPLFDTMARRTLQTYRAVAKNNFGVELKNTLNSTMENQQTNIDEILDNVDQQESLLQEGKDGKAPTFTVFENGEKVTYEITQDMYEALKPISDSSLLSTTFKPFNKISNFHRGVLTEYNPVFMLTNGIKDIQDILLNSQHAAKTYSKFGESYAQIIKKGYWYQEYMANGGEQNSYFDSQEGTFDTERKGIAKVLDTFPLKQISQLNNVIEMAPRLAEYIASREAGRSIETSMLDAARVTTNFKAGGDLTKWANRNGATFLNASIQGAMQQVRNVREAHANGLKGYANLATKFALAGVPAMILNALLWGDDDDYEELSDYAKQSYWIVGKYGDGNFIRIPKGRMISVIQESFNQMKNAISGDDEADLGQFLEVMATNIAPNNPIENNVLSPIIQATTNKTWYGEDLVPTRLQDVPSGEQYDESIDKLSIALGQALNISPYKINYVLDQYSGGVGDVLLPMMTTQAETGTDSVGEKLIAPLTNKFTVDSTMKNQTVNDLYTLSEELTKKANSLKATDTEIIQNKFLNSVKGDMNELYKQKRETQANEQLSDSEKYSKVREIQKQINDMAKNALNNYENATVKDNYSDVGGKEYFKNNDGEWTKVDDKEAEALSNFDMSATDKDTYFKAKNTISSIVGDYKESKATYDEESDEYKEAVNTLSNDKKEEIAETVLNTNLDEEQKAYLYSKSYLSEKKINKILEQSDSFDNYLKYEIDTVSIDNDDDKKAYLQSADYSDNDKVAIYENVILSDFDNEEKYKGYKTVKATGIDINSWLALDSQEFKADKYSNGKTISGSRKNKVISYVNSLELSKVEKAIMIKASNTFKFNDYNGLIVNYVGGLDVEYDEKVKILENLDMTVSNGKVYWK